MLYDAPDHVLEHYYRMSRRERSMYDWCPDHQVMYFIDDGGCEQCLDEEEAYNYGPDESD